MPDTPPAATPNAVTASPKTTAMGVVTALAIAWLFVGHPLLDGDPLTLPNWDGLVVALGVAGFGAAASDGGTLLKGLLASRAPKP